MATRDKRTYEDDVTKPSRQAVYFGQFPGSNALRSESLEVGIVCTGIGSQTGAAIGKFVGKSVSFCGNHPASCDMADVSVRSESVDRTKTCTKSAMKNKSGCGRLIDVCTSRTIFS